MVELLFLSKLLTTFYNLTCLGEEFWDLYLNGFRPSNYFDVEFDLYTDEPYQSASNDEREFGVPNMRKDRTKKLKLIHTSHFGQKENIQNQPDDDTDYGIVNLNKLDV